MCHYCCPMMNYVYMSNCYLTLLLVRNILTEGNNRLSHTPALICHSGAPCTTSHSMRRGYNLYIFTISGVEVSCPALSMASCVSAANCCAACVFCRSCC